MSSLNITNMCQHLPYQVAYACGLNLLCLRTTWKMPKNLTLNLKLRYVCPGIYLLNSMSCHIRHKFFISVLEGISLLLIFQYSVVKFWDKRNESIPKKHLFFIFFEWKNNVIEESHLVYTTTPWSIGAGLCGVFLMLHRYEIILHS